MSKEIDYKLFSKQPELEPVFVQTNPLNLCLRICVRVVNSQRLYLCDKSNIK